jgi:hypothetical protein
MWEWGRLDGLLSFGLWRVDAGLVEETSSLTPRPATQQSLSCSNTSVYGAQLGSSSALLLGMQPQSLCAAYTMQTGRIWFIRLNTILTGVSPQHSYQLKQALAQFVPPLWVCCGPVCCHTMAHAASFSVSCSMNCKIATKET